MEFCTSSQLLGIIRMKSCYLLSDAFSAVLKISNHVTLFSIYLKLISQVRYLQGNDVGNVIASLNYVKLVQMSKVLKVQSKC